MYQQHQHFKDPQLDPDLKEVWYAERALLDIFQDDTSDVIAFIQECDSADLHQFNAIHGVPQEVEIYKAILHHPKCDRATAINIFAACDPTYFERKLASGVGFDDLEDEEDRVFFQILVLAHQRLTNRESWRGRYDVNPVKVWANSSKYHPQNLKHFHLSAATMRPTQNAPAISAIMYEYSIIALTFEAWRHRH